MKRVGWTLCASVPKHSIQKSIHEADVPIWRAVILFVAIILLIIAAAITAVNKAVKSITHPLELLEQDIKIISDGDLNYRATVYRNDEIGDITSGMNEMVDKLNATMKELTSSQQHADAMSRLATLDTLTGIRNKTAFDRQMKNLTKELYNGNKEFGFVMVDLNNLKVFNDTYGHDKGDFAIKKLCHIICEVFSHSAVFRVGGDEFIVILKNDDYRNVDSLVIKFKEKISMSCEEENGEPWEQVSAAIGYALYDDALDHNSTDNVLARADQEMYACKKKMKEEIRRGS
jgi:diguanylate cyclase (GGDEF)-like protein